MAPALRREGAGSGQRLRADALEAEAGRQSGDPPEGCTAQVVLFAVGKATPADYGYPATRDAILGSAFAASAEFLEVNRSGQRILIAKTKTRSATSALAAHIQQRIAGSRPAVVCEAVPEIIRTIPMH